MCIYIYLCFFGEGIFVYRNIEDLEEMIIYARFSKRAVVIGGGLLGLEAAKAVSDLGQEPRLSRLSRLSRRHS